MRQDLEARILINEQIIADLRNKEEEAMIAAEEQEAIMKDKLDKKEYGL